MAEIGNTAVFSQTDANNNSGTVPTFAEGMAPSQVNDSARAFMGAITREWNWRNATLTTTGSANAYILTYGVAPAALYNGQTFAFLTNFANTGSATLNINSLGAKTIKKVVAGVKTALASGDIASGALLAVAYNSGDDSFLILSGAATADVFLASANVFTADQTIQSTDAGATSAPSLIIDRNSASPASGDYMGQIIFRGKDSGNNSTDYAVIKNFLSSPTDTDEIGTLDIWTRNHGILAERAYFKAGFVVSGNGVTLGGDPGAGAINAAAHYQHGNIIFPRGHIDGLIMSTDAANNVTIAAGQALDDSGLYVMTLGSSITKQMSGTWVVGNNQGGLDAGAEAANTWYHLWLIERTDTGVVDVLISTSASAPTMPTNYTKKRRIGSIRNNGSSNIIQFSQVGDEFLWDAAVVDVDATNPGTAAVTRTLLVPSGVKVWAQITVGWYSGTANTSIVISSLDVSDQQANAIATAALTGFTSFSGIGAGGWSMGFHSVRTNTSSQVRSRAQASGAGDHLGIITRGWIDQRGRNA